MGALSGLRAFASSGSTRGAVIRSRLTLLALGFAAVTASVLLIRNFRPVEGLRDDATSGLDGLYRAGL